MKRRERREALEMPPRTYTHESDVILKENESRNITIDVIMGHHPQEAENSEKSEVQTVRKPGSKYRNLLDTTYLSLLRSILNETQHKKRFFNCRNKRFNLIDNVLCNIISNTVHIRKSKKLHIYPFYLIDGLLYNFFFFFATICYIVFNL